MRLPTFFTATLFMCFSLLSGCTTAPQFISNVDSLAQTNANAKIRYVLLPGGKGVEASDLQYQEFAGYIEKVLAEKGFKKASDIQNADVAILFTYAIGDPQTYEYSYSMPTWGQTGVSSSNTYGTVSSYGGTATYSGTTTYTPTYGVTGSQTYTDTGVVFTRFLSLDAYDVASYIKENKMNQVWKTKVMSTGYSGDLRLVVPYMVTAMKPYLGTNTGRQIEVTLSEDDSYVQLLRGAQSSITN